MTERLGLFLIGLLMFFGCAHQLPDDEALFSVIEENLQMNQEENIEGSLLTIHEGAAGYSEMKAGLKQMFDVYDFTYEIKEMEVLEKSKEEAKVRFIQITRKSAGPEFNDNELEGVHTLKRSPEGWKIYNTEVTDIIFLSDKEQPRKD